MSNIIKIAMTSDLSPGTGTTIEMEGQSIALFNVEGNFYAIANTCTHRGGSLGEGRLNGDIVTCPKHGAHFNVKTGEVTFPPARFGVKTFPVTIEGDDVLITLD